MNEKLITIALLPYSQAEILRSMLEAEGIECTLENINLIQGAVASGVKVRINEKDIKKAWPMIDQLLGKEVKDQVKSEDTILVPVDFSTYSFKAGLMAFELAQKLGSKLIFFHVIQQPDFFSMPYSDVMAFNTGLYDHLKEREELANEELSKFVTKIKDYVGKNAWEAIESEHIIKLGYPEDDILYFTDKHPPRLIVMGIKGPDEKNPEIMGSTTAGVIYKSPVPVLVIPAKAPLLNLASMKHIVYATNFDDKDLVSIDKLLGLLKPFKARLSCLHVGPDAAREWDEAKLESLHNLLSQKYPDTPIECIIQQGANILEDLDKFIEEHQIDVLSLTTHKRNMITRIFNPSIARKMVFHVKTPLLVFHS
ncbi:universal stress protein [Mangrovibacterium marinum]|uniref:Nucleotide-binding universal stress UspA family protein n=1 Tax=Mangrovibacterium marinum TaxID=1639118 RepID=A0A2T5C701_9BACT|nr:universal stress protein [Mangrovibacterium marinum]PTN10692.1 nucleotide-binding universal stress UspA family protein [Mangrovibacterium marinum]